jgi:hypothetical protein
MSGKALKRWALVNYAGYPFAPNSLMPDNGLANLAGALLETGGEVEILDYCTVSTLARMTSPDLSRRLKRAWNTLRAPGDGWRPRLKQFATLATLRGAERERRALQEASIEGIAEELVAHIRRRGLQAVGFKLWNGDGFAGSVRLAAHLRRHCPQVKLFGGGPHVDLFMERILRRHPVFDALVYGEGEDTLRRLAEGGGDSREYGRIPNLIHRSGGEVLTTRPALIEDLDRLPMPAYDPAIYPAMTGHEKIKVLVLDESRGCRNECAFCIHPVKSNRQVRTKSIGRLVEELATLDRRHGYRHFRFAGSCTPYALLNAFAARVLAEGMKVRYASFAHVRDSGEADFAGIRASGGVALFFGLESGSQRILDAMHKGITVGQLRETVNRCHAAGIFTVGSLIFPAPGETGDTEAETLATLARLNLDSVLLQAPIVTPRTRWFEQADQYGISVPDRDRYLETAMHWKVKVQLPPRFWDPLPIRIGRQSYRKVLARAGALARQLAARGLTTAMSDETYLMSVMAGHAPAAFRDRALAAFFAGDSHDVQDLVETINSGAAEIRG